jgi:two-component system invasion response regulator UvrY
VLLDISMPDMNGIDALQQIKQWKPELAVLILSSHPEEIYAINLLRAGAGGYLNKDCAPAELAGAIRTVASGGKYVSSALRRQLASESRGDVHKMPHTGLSQREFQVFYRLADGQALSEIAKDLRLSVKTVASYRARLLEKMGMRTVADITASAIKHGLIQ